MCKECGSEKYGATCDRERSGTTKTYSLQVAAIKWWERFRPINWTLDQHKENPCINCCTEAEKELAKIVSKLIG